jgi:hypothetical protein
VPNGSPKWVECVRKGTGHCFVAGTLVLAAQGAVAIETLSPGDYVYANTWVNEKAVECDEAAGIYVPCQRPGMDWLTSADQRQLDAMHYQEDDLWQVRFSVPAAGGDSSKVTLLRPPVWMKEHGIDSVGTRLYLDMPEAGIGGIARVVALKQVGKLVKPQKNIEKYLALSPVTGIFEHSSVAVWQLVFSNSDTLGVTETHPFFSATRGMWVAAESLYEGEKVYARDTVVTLQEKFLSLGSERVYNLEVAQQHNFLVGDAGIVVHNNYISKLVSFFTYRNWKRTHPPGTQSEETITHFIQSLRDGDLYEFYKDPIYTTTYKGTTYLIDGHHRFEAAKRFGLANLNHIDLDPTPEALSAVTPYRNIQDVIDNAF